MFKDIVEDQCKRDENKVLIQSIRDITFPGYDSKLPNIVLDWKEEKDQNRLKKYIEDNIDCSEEYPCLNEFEEFLNLEVFNQEYYKINKDNNSFILKSCWIIQALGTLKLFKDIDSKNILDDFKFTHFNSIEEANDDNKSYYELLSLENKDEIQLIKNIITNHKKNKLNSFREFAKNEPNSENKQADEINSSCLYKLKNISTFIAYNSIKYFYYVIQNKGEQQAGFDMKNYETEEVDYISNIRVEVDYAYNIIHSQSYEGVLFAFAESYKQEGYWNFSDECFIVCKRFKLKSEDIVNGYGNIKSKLFLPGFLPIYGMISEPFIETFKDNYIEMRRKSFYIKNGNLKANIKLLREDLIKAIKVTPISHILKSTGNLLNCLKFVS